jgi:hypothetical protein
MNRPDHLLVALTALVKLKSTHESAHSLRIKLASKIVDSVNAFICDEVLDAVDKTRPNHMTWEQVGNVMGLSKSAVFSRYGTKKKRGYDN